MIYLVYEIFIFGKYLYLENLNVHIIFTVWDLDEAGQMASLSSPSPVARPVTKNFTSPNSLYFIEYIFFKKT